MLPRQRHEVMVSDLIRPGHQIGTHDTVGTTQIIRDKAVTWISEKSPQHTERLVGRHAVTEQRMGRNSREAQLRHWTGSELSDAAKPSTRRLMMLVVFP